MINIEIDDTELNKNLTNMIEKLLPDAIKNGLTESSILIEGAAKEKCPIDDGTLRASITHEVTQTEATIGTNAEYAPYAHEGTGIYATEGYGRMTPWSYQDSEGEWHTTVGQHPNPFLKNAVEEKRGQILKCFENKLGSGRND